MEQEEKPHAPSCDRNQEPIFNALKSLLLDRRNLLEIGSGTGQHAVFMAPKLSHLTWTLSDLKDRHRGISLWLREKPILNIRGPVHYEAGLTDFPHSVEAFDAVFTSNTLHIMPWSSCLALFDDLEKNLLPGTLFIVYGAFKYGGEFTTESNKDFEEWLKERNPKSGLKNFEDVRDELKKRSFELLDDISMPSNNQLLVFTKMKRTD
jgi:cyclopropane fatty-acyl-phospholipid synthase-like methyltransferase